MNFLAWLEQTTLSVWVRETPSIWAFPFVLFLHTLGLAIVAGLSVAVNVWVLGFARRAPSAPLLRLFPVIWTGFTINLVSGLLLLVAFPTKALTDPVFYLKMGLIFGAVLQLVWLRARFFEPAAAPAGRLAGGGGGAPAAPHAPELAVRLSAVAAIGLWAGAVLTGRLLAYTYNYLMAADFFAGR